MTMPRGTCLLPLPLPAGRIERSVLFAVRRMAAHGVRDVSAAWLILDQFSTGFRRPLVLLRAFMLELSHTATASIRVAPCCATRMTEHEGLILLTLFGAADDMTAAEDALVQLTRNKQVFEPLSAAAVFGRAIGEQVRVKG
jgi:hypothetical protein